MEHPEASSDLNWGSFSSSVPTEDPEIMALLFSNTSLADESQGWQNIDFHPSVYSIDDESNKQCYGSNDVQNGMYYWPNGCSSNSGGSSFVSHTDAENYYFNDPNAVQPGNFSAALAMDFFMADEKNDAPAAVDNLGEESSGFIGEARGGSQVDTGLKFLELASRSDQKPSAKRRIPMPDADRATANGKEGNAGLNPKKKSRSTADLQKSGKNAAQPRKAQKGFVKATLSDDTGLVRQSSSSDSSEEDSITSQDLNGDAGTSSSSKATNIKTRAGRGSATDPQSLYARKRRERINERLKILQNLVPNGTKVDISTMLEEAVQYVKFLQLQIKLLSSDDLWMYAPIAYNGMDIGLDLKITPPQ